MLCQICHAEEATVYLIETLNQKQWTMHICENCAQKKNLGEMLSKPALAIHELLASLLHLGSATQQAKEELTCKKCGTTFAQFKQIGRFGCAECYTAFRENLLPLFRQFHQAEEHRGRWSAGAASSKQELQELKAQLQKAVAEESFEAAAQLRDRIRRMEKGEGS